MLHLHHVVSLALSSRKEEMPPCQNFQKDWSTFLGRTRAETTSEHATSAERFAADCAERDSTVPNARNYSTARSRAHAAMGQTFYPAEGATSAKLCETKRKFVATYSCPSHTGSQARVDFRQRRPYFCGFWRSSCTDSGRCRWKKCTPQWRVFERKSRIEEPRYVNPACNWRNPKFAL
jgi:hypothetical protein